MAKFGLILKRSMEASLHENLDLGADGQNSSLRLPPFGRPQEREGSAPPAPASGGATKKAGRKRAEKVGRVGFLIAQTTIFIYNQA